MDKRVTIIMRRRQEKRIKGVSIWRWVLKMGQSRQAAQCAARLQAAVHGVIRPGGLKEQGQV